MEASKSPREQVKHILSELEAVEPEFGAEERVLWTKRANRFQSAIRAVGGRIYLTDRRLVFASHRFDAKFGGEEWSAPLERIEEVFVRGPFRTVRVRLDDGMVERFVAWPSRDCAELIGAAADAARKRAGGDQPA